MYTHITSIIIIIIIVGIVLVFVSVAGIEVLVLVLVLVIGIGIMVLALVALCCTTLHGTRWFNIGILILSKIPPISLLLLQSDYSMQFYNPNHVIMIQ
jgi:c-di-AMP phosphodiesterase-like protein